MGARRVSNAANEKVIALMSMGMTATKAAAICGVSSSYCDKLYKVAKFISNGDYDSLISLSKVATTGNVIKWCCEYLNTPLPQEVTNAINAPRYRPCKPADNTPPSRKNWMQ